MSFIVLLIFSSLVYYFEKVITVSVCIVNLSDNLKRPTPKKPRIQTQGRVPRYAAIAGRRLLPPGTNWSPPRDLPLRFDDDNAILGTFFVSLLLVRNRSGSRRVDLNELTHFASLLVPFVPRRRSSTPPRSRAAFRSAAPSPGSSRSCLPTPASSSWPCRCPSSAGTSRRFEVSIVESLRGVPEWTA